MLNKLNRAVELIVQVGGWALLGAACLVTYDVITRKLFNISIAGADEISGYVFAVSTACAFSYALLQRSNIRIDIVYKLMPPQVQRLLDIAGMVLTGGFLAIICVFAFTLVSDAIVFGSRSITPLQTPLAIPQTLWFAGLCLAVLTSLALTAAAIAALVRGDGAEAKRLIGIPSLDEEIESEVGSSAGEDNSGGGR